MVQQKSLNQQIFLGNSFPLSFKEVTDQSNEPFLVELPFLFKVLSVNKALSIQAHPDKSLASHLHLTRPDIYKDPNHKPEMTIALGDFEALCGFKGEEEIEKSIEAVPILKEIVKEWSGLKDAFTKVMNGEKKHVLEHHQFLFNTQKERTLTQEDVLFQTLYSQFPNDIGCLCAYFLNYIKLYKGEALFLTANEPHAYLKGDCIEVMAPSDNVVRAGLTPKYRDVSTLCDMLTYKSWRREDLIVKPIMQHKGIKASYRVAVQEFAVDKFEFAQVGCNEVIEEESVLIVIRGGVDVGGSTFKAGAVIYVNETIEIRSTEKETLVFVAFQP